MDPTAAAQAWLDRFFDHDRRRRPVNATFVGEHAFDADLPDLSEAGAGDTLAETEALLAEVRELPAVEPGGVTALDVCLASGYLRAQRWELTSRHGHRGSPSLYTGEAVFGVIGLFLGHAGALTARLDAARSRMRGIPAFLAQARANVREAPAAWTRRALRECDGALALFGGGIGLLEEELGLDAGALRAAADLAGRAFEEHRLHLATELANRATDGVGAGDEALDLQLREVHFLERSAEEIAAYARAALAEAQARLREEAAALGFTTPAAALAHLGERCPGAGEYLRRFEEHRREMWEVVEEHELVTVPDHPLRFEEWPPWVRGAAPYLYFLSYRSPAALRPPAEHVHRVASLDPAATAAERRAVLRSHPDAVIKLNHVVHHAGLGHHLQNWHAFRAESRVGRVAAVDCASRIAMGCGGTMAEGWACYATDLVREVGWLTPLERCTEHAARTRMACRAVVDVELHRGAMTLADAAAFYVEHAGMGSGAARSEAVKNSMFPGGALMYLTGVDAIHELRRETSVREGAAFRLRRFHDTFLSWGSVPVSLIARAMRGEEPVDGG